MSISFSNLITTIMCSKVPRATCTHIARSITATVTSFYSSLLRWDISSTRYRLRESAVDLPEPPTFSTKFVNRPAKPCEAFGQLSLATMTNYCDTT